MKVAIVTIHHVPNYGAVAQAFSLRQAILRLGHQCDVIDYRPDVAIETYRKRRGKFPKSLFQQARYVQIGQFVKRNVISGDQRIFKQPREVFDEIAKYDTVVCGSDQIWNVTGFRGVDETFFLGSAKLPSTKRIAYAPSIGSSDPLTFHEHFPQCEQWLREFDAISVRDVPSQRMVAGYGLPEPEIVCDPTLLPNALDSLSSVKPGSRNILLVYGVPSSCFEEQIKAIAQRHQLRIVSVGTRCRYADKTYFFASPKKWVELFARARLVVTKMFHGVQLALLNDVPPIYAGTLEKKAKVWDVLQRYQLEDLYVEKPSDLRDVDFTHLFLERMNRVKDRKNRIAAESLQWLRSQLV